MPALSKQLKSLILISALVVLTGIAILLVLLLIEDSIVQVILIALILLLWPLGFLISHYRRHLAAKNAAPAGATASGADGAIEKNTSQRPARSYEHLEGGVIEVIEFLRRNRLGKAQGGDAIYNLPWYLVAGPPASGKTSMLLSAGLSFHALESQRQADQNLLRPTRHCDWRVTDDAVLIDTAGRYLTEGVDRDEWLGLIETLKKYRKQRSLDGVVLTVNAGSLMAIQNATELRQQGQILRTRLNELMAPLGARFPVYLVFAHADRIPGFAQFFRSLRPEERSQVWGATFPLKYSEKAHALFDEEFNLLFQSLLNRRLLNLGVATGLKDQQGARDQLSVFDFPLNFAAARQKLGEFTNALFSPNPFNQLPLLRGIYFTSCSATPQRAATGLVGEVRISNKGFFAEDFFKNVLLPDRHIAAALQVTQARPNRTRKLAIAAAVLGVISLLLLLGMVNSYFNNRGLLKDGELAGANVLRHFKAVDRNALIGTGGLTTVESEDLNRLQEVLMTLDQLDGSWSKSLPYRFGLYSGNWLRPRLRQIYFDFVTQRLLDPALDGLGRDLDGKTPAPAAASTQAAAADDQEQRYYDELKAYKMVERQERVEPAFLQEQLGSYWQEGTSAAENRHLAYYAEQARLMDEDDESVPRPQVSTDRVNSARAKLKNYAAEKQIYNQIIRNIAEQGQPYLLRDVVQGQQGSEWIEDVSSPKVPYQYTKQAYYAHVKGGALAEIFGELRTKNENDWVLDRSADYQRVEPKNLIARYENDYITAWQKFLNALRVKRFEKKSDAVAALEAFAQPNSPFVTIIDQVKTQTKLSEPPASGGILAWLKAKLTPKSGSETTVEKSFAALGSFNVETYLNRLKELRSVLSGARGDEWSQVASLKDDEKYNKARDGLREILTPLKTSQGSAAVAELLARPLDNVEIGLGRGVEKDRNAAWSSLVGVARRLETRYPFAAGSNEQVLPNELADYLNKLAQFYNQYLKDSFDSSGSQLKPLRAGEFSQEFIEYLRKIFDVRNAFAPPGSQQLKFSYSITLQPPAGQSAEMRVDGISIKAEGAGQTATPNWPASGQENGVKIGILQNGQFNLVKSYDGAWGIFKMAAERGGGGSQYQFNWGGVRAILQPGVNNPFQINFSQIRAPQNLK